ncbi:MAG: coniferyl-alcohol dehydrogenase [Rhodospirillales bacterium]|nr:coniferyl-alcohol dehydrogenase [Rhodospirillales bacterium]
MSDKIQEYSWKGKKILKRKSIVVTGCSSGIGWETARVIKKLGGDVLGVDLNMTTDNVDEFYKADLSDKMTIDALIEVLPKDIDGIANCAGLPPTSPAELVIKVNLVGLKYFTEQMIPKLSSGSSIVNLASLAGFGWADSVAQIKESYDLDFHEVEDFVRRYGIDQEKGRSYFFTKEALIVWTMKQRWEWRDRDIRMNSISPGPVETPIYKDFLETLGERAEEDRKVMDRPGLPTDIAPFVCFMLSDMSSWMRGINVPLDGGMSSHLLCKIHNL